MTIAYKGKYRPINPVKYNGDPTKITYRSLWERHFMVYLDTTEEVLWWNSEAIAVPYVSPADNKIHSYYPDFVFHIRENHKDIEKLSIEKTYMIEIKPQKQTKPPNPKRKKTKSLYNEQRRYAINKAKWKQAMKYCDIKEWHFKLLTEADIFTKPLKRYKKGRK